MTEKNRNRKKYLKKGSAAALALLLILALSAPAGSVLAESSAEDPAEPTDTPADFTEETAEVAASVSDITVLLNGEELTFDAKPEILDGTTFVPLRGVFEQLGAEVEWNGERQEAFLTSGRDEICLKVGSTVAIRNTEVSTLSDAPYLKDDRVMVPLRYLSESLNYDVTWNGKTRVAEIDAPEDSTQAGNSGQSGDQEKDPDDSEKDADGTVSAGKPSSFGEGGAFSILGTAADITCNEAIKDGLRESSACKGARLSLRQAEQQLDEFYRPLYLQLHSIITHHADTEGSQSSQRLVGEGYVVVTEEQTAYSIVNAMNEISLKQVEIEAAKEELREAEKSYQTDLLQYQAGALSQSALRESEAAIDTAGLQVQAKETELQGLYISFYGTIGEEDFSDLQEGNLPALEFHIDYEPIGEVDVEKSWRQAKENDPYLWYLKNSMDNADFKLQSYEYNVGGKSYELTQMDLTRARINYNSTEANLKTTMESRYNQLLQLENQISSLENQKETLRRSIDTMRTMYEAGMQREQLWKKCCRISGRSKTACSR